MVRGLAVAVKIPLVSHVGCSYAFSPAHLFDHDKWYM